MSWQLVKVKTTRRSKRLLRWLVWGYLLLDVTALLAVRLGGDRWWPATLLLFGPRWALALPLMILVPLAGWLSRRLLLPLLVTALLLFGPFMGLCLPLGGASATEGPAVKVLTCNIQNGKFDRKALSFLIFDSGADIVALQECPRELGLELPGGWYVVQEGDLAILSRYPLRSRGAIKAFHPPDLIWPRISALSCSAQLPKGMITFCSIHLPTARYGLHNVLDRNTFLSLKRTGYLREETIHRQQVSKQVREGISALDGPVIVAGDFNMPVESAIYQEDWGGYTNVFSRVGLGYGWTSRADVKGVVLGVRVDHILTEKEFMPVSCEVGSDVGSDHLPVIAEIARVAAVKR